MTKALKNFFILTLCVLLSTFIIACGGSSGGDDVTIEGTLGTTAARMGLAEGATGVSGITVSALGDSDVTDGNGKFVLKADGNVFTGGSVVFAFSGDNVAREVTMPIVAGGPGADAFVDFTLASNGSISGISSDSDGNVLSTVTGIGCTEEQSFFDGGGGRLWKPVSESTGTVCCVNAC